MTSKPDIPLTKIRKHLQDLEQDLLNQHLEWALQRDSKLTTSEIRAAAILESGQEVWWCNPILRDSEHRIAAVVERMNGRKATIRYKNVGGWYGAPSSQNMASLHPRFTDD